MLRPFQSPQLPRISRNWATVPIPGKTSKTSSEPPRAKKNRSRQANKGMQPAAPFPGRTLFWWESLRLPRSSSSTSLLHPGRPWPHRSTRMNIELFPAAGTTNPAPTLSAPPFAMVVPARDHCFSPQNRRITLCHRVPRPSSVPPLSHTGPAQPDGFIAPAPPPAFTAMALLLLS